MKVSKRFIIKAKISKLCGITSLCYFLNRNKKRIVGYHNIIPDEYYDNSIHLEYSHSESVFKEQLNIINKRFNVNLKIEEEGTLTLTFDDGYFNQYSIASKTLDAMDNKGYFFCSVDLIDNIKILEIDKLMYWISYVPKGEYYLKEIDYKLVINNDYEREEHWSKLYNMISENFKFEELSSMLNNTYNFSKIRINENFYNIRFNGITKDKLDEMKRNGHIIGAHSVTHSILSKISENEMRKEIEQCRELLDNVYNTKIFAYPYGGKRDIPSNISEILRENEFERAVAYGNGEGKNEYHDYFIPRIILPNVHDKDVIDFILSGAMNLINHRNLLPNWSKREVNFN